METSPASPIEMSRFRFALRVVPRDRAGHRALALSRFWSDPHLRGGPALGGASSRAVALCVADHPKIRLFSIAYIRVMPVPLRAAGWIREVPMGDRLRLKRRAAPLYEAGTGRVRLAYWRRAGGTIQPMRDGFAADSLQVQPERFVDARSGCGQCVSVRRLGAFDCVDHKGAI